MPRLLSRAKGVRQIPVRSSPCTRAPACRRDGGLAGREAEVIAPLVAAPKVLLLDKYDSFTFNLFHRLGELGARVEVRRNDACTPDEAVAIRPDAVVISPGPCDPDRAGISLGLIERASRVCPVLGVCLGHQAIGQAFGGAIVRAPFPMHGKVSLIHHDNTGMFAGLPNPFRATRYHSLIVERESLPSVLRIKPPGPRTA